MRRLVSERKLAVSHVLRQWRWAILWAFVATLTSQARGQAIDDGGLPSGTVTPWDQAQGAGFPEVIRPSGARSTLLRQGESPEDETIPSVETSRFDTLPGVGPALRAPKPNAQTRQEYERYIEGTIDPQMELQIIVGRPRILKFKVPPKKIYQSDETVLTHTVITPTAISLVGVKPGVALISFWMNDGKDGEPLKVLTYWVEVLPEPRLKERLTASYEALEKEINGTFPDSKIDLSLVGDQLVVRGQAKDSLEAAQILNILSQYGPSGRGGRRGGQRPDDQRLDVFVDRDPVTDEERLAEGRTVIDQQRLAAANIVNLLYIPGEQQVTLRVTVAEVNRTALRSIGVNFNIRNRQGDSIFRTVAGQLSPLGQTNASAGNPGLANIPVGLDNGQISLAINALRTLRLARTLAEPNLTALNGRVARFQAGGRFPVPIVGGFTNRGLQGVAFIPFGVQLQFTPYILDRDRVRLTMSAEVSTRDESLGAQVGGSAAAGGTNVSGLNTRNFSTTIELREGQTMSVAGLIQTNYGADSDRVPFWGDLPIIGSTGGFNRVSSGEQELVILITPELVHPLDACETPNLPGSDTFEPTDIEFFLGNRLESARTRDYRASVRTDWHKIRDGDKYCEDTYIIGPSGPTYGCCPTGACNGRQPSDAYRFVPTTRRDGPTTSHAHVVEAE